MKLNMYMYMNGAGGNRLEVGGENISGGTPNNPFTQVQMVTSKGAVFFHSILQYCVFNVRTTRICDFSKYTDSPKIVWL